MLIHNLLLQYLENRKQLWIPEGFAHGFLTLSNYAELLYKTTNFYNQRSEKTIRFDSNLFNIKWKYIALIFIGLDVFRMLLGLNSGGYVSHIGGYLLGFYYAKKLLEGKDIGSGFERLMDRVMSLFRPKSNLKTVHRKNGKSSYAGKTKTEFDTFNKQKQIEILGNQNTF